MIDFNGTMINWVWVKNFSIDAVDDEDGNTQGYFINQYAVDGTVFPVCFYLDYAGAMEDYELLLRKIEADKKAQRSGLPQWRWN